MRTRSGAENQGNKTGLGYSGRLNASVGRLNAARQIKEMSPLTPILIFSLHPTEAFLEVAQKIGVSGYIAKNENIQSFLKAVEAALHNQTYFPG